MQNSETDVTREQEIIPAWARAAGLLRCFAYHGRSMSPTFRVGHLLYVRPTARDVAPGDVIVFARPSENDYLVHRVVAVTDVGLITRGDNNLRNDESPIMPVQVIGRVEALAEQGRFKPVPRGRNALRLARIRWSTRWAVSLLRDVVGLPYRVLRRSETARQLLLRMFAPHFEYISFQTPQGTFVKVLHHGRIVARRNPQRQHWECEKPYDLVLRPPDEA